MLSIVDEINICRVCGYLDKKVMPWGANGKYPSDEICACCSSQFGYHDITHNSTCANRKQWIENGAHWRMIKYKPSNWNLIEQLKQIPQEYRDEYLEEYIKNHS